MGKHAGGLCFVRREGVPGSPLQEGPVGEGTGGGDPGGPVSFREEGRLQWVFPGEQALHKRRQARPAQRDPRAGAQVPRRPPESARRGVTGSKAGRQRWGGPGCGRPRRPGFALSP